MSISSKANQIAQAVRDIRDAFAVHFVDATNFNILTFADLISACPLHTEWYMITGWMNAVTIPVYRTGMRIRNHAFHGSRSLQVLGFELLDGTDIQDVFNDGSVFSELGDYSFAECPAIEQESLQMMISNTRKLGSHFVAGGTVEGKTIHIPDYKSGDWDIDPEAFAGAEHMTLVIDDMTDDELVQIDGFPRAWGLPESSTMAGGSF